MTENDTRAELADVERRIAELEESADELRAETGGQDEGPLDAEERAAALTNTEELEGILEGLRARREALQRELDG